MKLSVTGGVVTCSLEDKNSSFLAECTGMFEGFINGKLKLYQFKAESGMTEDGANECNADMLDRVINLADKYSVEVSDEVKELSARMQTLAHEISAKRRVLEEERERAEKWERLCKHGCGRCTHLKYIIDVPKCEKTGEELEEKNIPKNVNGAMQLFRFVAFPSENCPFNNKKQGV